MVLSNLNSDLCHLVLTSCAAAILSSSERPKWRHTYGNFHPTILTLILGVLVVLAANVAVGGASINPPNLFRDLPARISYFMEDGLTLNCSLLSDASRKSHSSASGIGGGHGSASKSGGQAIISWYKVRDTGRTFELKKSGRYAFQGNGRQLVIQPIVSRGQSAKELKEIKGSYYCQAKNSHGETRSRKCVVEPVSSANSVSRIRISGDSISIHQGGTAVLSCKIQPEYAHSFYRVLRWEVISNRKTTVIANSTEKYSLVKSIYPSELHIRRMSVEDTKRRYRCVVESTIRQKNPLQSRTKASPLMTVTLNPDGASFLRPYLQISHRHVSIRARQSTSVELPCVYVSNSPVKYTWTRTRTRDGTMNVYPLKDPKSVWRKKYQIVAADHGNLRITNLGENDSGVYECKGKTSTDSAKDHAKILLNVSAPLGVTVDPPEQTVDYSKAANFSCRVHGYPLTQVYWLHDGQRVKPRANLLLLDDSRRLLINKVDRHSAGVYQCFAETGTEVAPEDNAQARSVLSVDKMPPQLVAQYPPVADDGRGRGHVLLGTVKDANSKDRKNPTHVRLRCDFVGSPDPRITWYRDDERIPLSGRVIKLPSAPWKELDIDMEKAYQTDNGNVDKGVIYGGEYKAVASNDYGKAECRTFVEVDAKMTIRDTKKLMEPIEGKTFRLMCYVLGRGTFRDLTITWKKTDKNGVEHPLPNNHRHSPEENGRALVIRKVKKEEDDGKYTCTAKNKAGMVVSHSVMLDVMRLPVINSFEKEHHLNEGIDKVTITCNIKNQADEPWFAWWVYRGIKNGHMLILQDSNSKEGVQITYAQNKGGSYVETINGVPKFVPANTWVMLEIARPEKAKHSGNYTCIIKNRVGQSHDSAIITFKPKIKFSVKPPPKMEVILNDTLTLRCTARGNNPKPTVEWKYFEKSSYVSIRSLEKATKKRISQDDQGTLVVRHVTKTDPTQFMCYVSLNVSDAEAISQVVKIKVHYPANIRPMEDQERKSGERFNLTCLVDGDGDIEVEWQFFSTSENRFKPLHPPCFTEKGSRPVAVPSCNKNYLQPGLGQFGAVLASHHKVNERSTMHGLQFSSVSQMHQTRYKCRARNKYNKNGSYAEQVVKLTVIGKPSEPKDIKANAVDARSITLTWSRPLVDGNKPILHYLVSVYRFKEKDHVSVPQAKRLKLKVPAKKGTSVYIKRVDGLHPAYEYRLEVSAVNAVGTSKVATVSTRTQEDKPSGPVQNISANGTSSDTIRISWSPPAVDKMNGLLIRYSVCLAQASSASADSEDVPTSDTFWEAPGRKKRCRDVPAVNDARGGVVRFTGLPKFTKYYIRVFAHNSKGKSPPQFSYAWTLEDVPRRPPIGVTCTVDTTTVKLEWNPPNQDDMNGILTGYTIQYFETNEFEDESMSKILNISSNTYATVSHLREYTNYTFRIYAVNSKGSGPPSEPAACHTKPSKPDKPAGVKVFPVNASCLAVTWRHPNNSRGRLTEYVIRYGPEYDEPSTVVTVPANTSASYNYKFICDLLHDAEYSVSVQAKNHAPLLSSFTAARKARTTENAPARILAFNDTVVTTNNVDLLLSCEHVGRPKVKTDWDTNYGETDGGPWLRVRQIKPSESGKYICKVENPFGRDFVQYNVEVRVIKATPPKTPKLSLGRTRLHSVEVEWRPTGSAQSQRKDTPIIRYWLTYVNEWTKERHVTVVAPSNRTFFLSNLTCGTNVDFTIKAENKIGNSSASPVVRMRTRGSRPIPVDSRGLMNNRVREHSIMTSAYLNLAAVFAPGGGCPPLQYRIFITEQENTEFKDPPIIVYYDNLKDQCCYNVTNLNAGSFYKYRIEARNAAGAENITGEFFTYTTTGKKPIIDPRHRETKIPFLQRPAVLVGLIFVLVIIVVIALGVVLFWRRKVTADQLREHEKGPVKRCVNDLKGDDGKQTEGLRHQFISAPLQAGVPPPQSRIRPRVEEEDERLSDDGSVDSDGNINPYATFATYETNTIDRHELPDAGPRELGAVERESDRMRERLTRMQSHNSQKGKRRQYYDHSGPKQYENESVPGTLAPLGATAKPRSNSMEDLDSVATYNRGYATGGGGQMGRSFYESKYTDQLTPYRGSSVISSTTMSSNHDELTQAYEYGRRARYESSLNTTDAFNDDNLDLHTGSGSSETTDPGIRQFTQQPPMPDEQRQATCEVPVFNKTGAGDPRRTSINPSDTYEAVDEAYYKGRLRLPMHHPARQAPLPDLPPMSATLGRPRLAPAGARAMGGPPVRHRTDSDSGYSGRGHVYDSTDSYYSSYTPSNFGRRGPMVPAAGVEFPRQRQMPSSRYYNGGGPSERHPLVAGGATAVAPRPHMYGPHAVPGADPEEARSLLMNSRRFSGRGSARGSSTGGSASGSSTATVAPGAGSRRPSRPGAGAGRPDAAAGAVGGPLIGAGLPRGDDDSDSGEENIYTSEFTVV